MSQTLRAPLETAEEPVSPASRVKHYGLIAAWLLILLGGFVWTVDYETRPGVPATAGQLWPNETGLTLAPRGSTLVMFMHPNCPCSLASLEELGPLVRRHPTVKAYVVFVQAEEQSPPPENISRANSIPGVTVCRDEDGREAGRFGSQTSGNLFVFNAAGQLTFEGGITPARGHVGENAGSVAAENAIEHPTGAARHTPVYGCPLF